MAESRRKGRARVQATTATGEGPAGAWEESERALGRAVAFGLPLASVLGAAIVGVLTSLGSGLLVLASGTLLGAIALVWTSVRTLSGDAPLAAGFQGLAARRMGVDALSEEKRRALRALKDLENEHALGKIDDGDYRAMVLRYRGDAKDLMRAMDLEVAPLREDAERIAREHLEKLGLAPRTEVAPTSIVSAPSGQPRPRVTCLTCETSNEPDAAFCKKCGTPVHATEKNDESA